MSCVFCDIAAGTSPASMVYEDEDTVAFMDLRQANPGHVLIVPRVHVEHVWELDDATAAALARTVVRMATAVRAAFEPDGMNIHQSNGVAAGQEVMHVHFHIMPRYHNDGLYAIYKEHPKPQPRETLDDLATQIRATLD
ncbi:MAG: HIT family protein [bacterium]|nr:HIT family protein [bacterium]